MATANIGHHLLCFLNSDQCSFTDCTGLDPPWCIGVVIMLSRVLSINVSLSLCIHAPHGNQP